MTPSSDLIQEYLAWMQLEQYEQTTIHERGRFLRRMDKRLPFGLEQAVLEELAEEIARPASPTGRGVYYDHFSGFYRWATDPDDRWLTSNPMVKMRRPRRPPAAIDPERLAANEHVQAILQNAVDPYRRFAVLAAYQGARCIEIHRLDKADVTEEWTLLRGKRSKPRKVPTHPYTWAVVRVLPAGPVARRVDGERMTRQQVSSKTAAYLRHRLGVPVSLHMLRHWFCTRALDEVPDLRTVQELAGHSSPATTALYTHVNAARKLRAVTSLPALA